MTKDLKPASDSSQKIAAKIQKNQRKTAKYETLKNQVEAIEKSKSKVNSTQSIAFEHGVTARTVQRWIQNEEKIRKQFDSVANPEAKIIKRV